MVLSLRVFKPSTGSFDERVRDERRTRRTKEAKRPLKRASKQQQRKQLKMHEMHIEKMHRMHMCLMFSQQTIRCLCRSRPQKSSPGMEARNMLR
jgi:hypothetical protein